MQQSSTARILIIAMSLVLSVVLSHKTRLQQTAPCTLLLTQNGDIHHMPNIAGRSSIRRLRCNTGHGGCKDNHSNRADSVLVQLPKAQTVGSEFTVDDSNGTR